MEVHATEVKMCFILLVIVKQFAEFRLTSSILYGYQSKSETNVKQYLSALSKLQTSVLQGFISLEKKICFDFLKQLFSVFFFNFILRQAVG